MEIQEYTNKIEKLIKAGSTNEAQALFRSAVEEFGLDVVEQDTDLDALGQRIEMELILSPEGITEREIDGHFRATSNPRRGKRYPFMQTLFETGEYPE
jgi:hypothetical protein